MSSSNGFCRCGDLAPESKPKGAWSTERHYNIVSLLAERFLQCHHLRLWLGAQRNITKLSAMATAIPPALRAADIARFAQRAGQVEKARPAIAYWCKLFRELPKRKADQEGNYWIVDRIIANGLHKADDDSKSYTMQLMDKLEQVQMDILSYRSIAYRKKG